MVSDTHLTADRLDRLPAQVTEAAAAADVILHAGDVVCTELLDVLGTHAPVHAVLGNNDRGLDGVLPDRLVVQLEGVVVAMVHDSGARTGRPARLRRWFPDADLVVFGHSHEPVAECDGDRWLVNPGSPTQRRRQPNPTFAVVDLAHGRVAAVDHVVVR